MTIRPTGLVTRTIALATSNGVGANIAPKMLTTRSKLRSGRPARLVASPSWNRHFVKPSSLARLFPASTRLHAISTPSTSAPSLADGSAVVPSPHPRSSTFNPGVTPSPATRAAPLSLMVAAMRVKSPFSHNALFGFIRIFLPVRLVSGGPSAGGPPPTSIGRSRQVSVGPARTGEACLVETESGHDPEFHEAFSGGDDCVLTRPGLPSEHTLGFGARRMAGVVE